MVGDSPRDMTAARTARVRAVAAARVWYPAAALRTAGAQHVLTHPSTRADLQPPAPNNSILPPGHSGTAPPMGCHPRFRKTTVHTGPAPGAESTT